MELEQFCTGAIICTLVCAASTLFAIYVNFISDDRSLEGFGYFLAMILMSIGFGTCLTYIAYMKGVI